MIHWWCQDGIQLNHWTNVPDKVFWTGKCALLNDNCFNVNFSWQLGLVTFLHHFQFVSNLCILFRWTRSFCIFLEYVHLRLSQLSGLVFEHVCLIIRLYAVYMFTTALHVFAPAFKKVTFNEKVKVSCTLACIFTCYCEWVSTADV